MALFKIFKGNSANLGKQGNSTQHAVEGYCYFTTDDHKFYIDIDSDATAEIGANRIALNAEYADKIVGAPTFSWVTDNTNKNIALAMQWAGHDTTQKPAILPPATLEHDGALSIVDQSIKGIKTFVNSPVFQQGTAHIGYDHYIAYPQGGHFTGQTIQYKGLLKIALPKSWSNTMLRFKVSIYNYNTNTSVDYYIGGYTYDGTSKWINTFAYCTGRYGTKLSNLPVSFGHDDTHCAITIGTSDTVWDCPQIAISDIIIGYSGNTYAQWATGWSISFIGSESLPIISTTCIQTNVAYKSEIANKLGTSDIGSATKPMYLKAGVPIACNDSLGVSITGNAASATKLTSNAGANNHPVYFSGGKPVATTYCMAATNTSPTTALSITTDLPTGIWYVNGTNGIFGAADGAVYVNQYSSSWIAEIYQDYRTGQLAVRGKNNGTWQEWRKILDSSNYTTYTVTKTGDGASGTNWNISIKGSAAKLTTAQTISLTGDVTGSTTFDGSKAASIDATVKDNSHSHTYNTINRGTTGNWAKQVAPIDRALINQTRACRTAFTPAEAIKVEYTKNGTDWIDYTLTEGQKRSLFTMRESTAVKLGYDGSPAVNMGVRITIEPIDRYCTVDTFYCWFSTYGHTCECTSIERSTIGAKETFSVVRSNVPVDGYPGPNEIQFPVGTYGGFTFQTNNHYKYRFTFKITKVGSTTSLPIVTDLRMYGDSCFSYSNNMMAMDSIYAWDIYQNVTFPARITAASLKLTTPITINGTNFDGSSSITTAKWGATKNVKITDKDGTNVGDVVSMGATTGNEYILKLPATIKATLSGNASTATKFASAQLVKLTGVVTGEVSSQAGWTVSTSIEDGKITNDMLKGSIPNEKLTNSKITIADNEISLGGSLSTSTLRESLGLSHAMHFIGKATVTITDGSNTDPKITGYDFATERLPGDVIVDSGSSYEYVWVSPLNKPSEGKWERLGGDSSYKVVQPQVSDPTASGNSSTFISTISQDANGQITATKANIATITIQVNGTGFQSYNASAAKTINFVQGNDIAITSGGNNITIKHANAAVTAKTAFASTATTAAADGGKIIVTDIKYDAYGHITGSTDRTITLSQIKEFEISAADEDDDIVILTGSTNGTNGVKYKATHKLAGPEKGYTSSNTTTNINAASVVKLPQITVDTYGHTTAASETNLTFVKPAAGNWFNQGFVNVNTDGVSELGRFLDFHPTSETAINYSARIDAGASTAERTLYLPDVTGQFIIHSNNTQVGTTNTPIYITAEGVATAFSANIGTNTQPIYMQEGGLVASDATIGSHTRPVFLNAGVITALGETIGSTAIPIYLNQGTITQCNAAQVFSVFGSTPGTTTGETLSITVAGQNRTITLDTASDTQAGVITNAAQTLAGIKTFKNDIILGNPAAITASRLGGAYYEARDLALIINNTPSTTNSYAPLYSLKGASGDFSSGILHHSDGTEGTLQWIYITDAGYNAHTNDYTNLMTLTATGALTATSFAGNGANLTDLSASKITTGTLAVDRLAASGVTAGYYGPPADNVPDHGGKIKVPYLNVDAKGRIISASTTQITLPTYTIGNAQITITAGKGLTDGGLFTTNATANKTITLAVGAGSGIVVNDDNVAVNTSYTTDGHKYALSADVISGALYTTVEQAWEDITNHTTCTINTSGTITGSKVFNAVWNDYAEFRKAETIEPGRIVIEDVSGEMKLSTERLQAGGNIISDTFGSAMGETAECQTPIAVAGRALVYTYEDRNSYPLGAAVCTGPNGTVSLMTREEIMMYPERIVGTVSEIPNYDTWGTGNIEVKGRIWIKVR